MKEIKSLNKDIVFKIVFKSIKEAIVYLLKISLNIDICKDDIFFMDTEVEPAKHNEKLIIADVLFNINESKYFCVEMQNILHSNFTKRLEFYLARIVNNIIKKKRKYKTFPSLYSIAFINDNSKFKRLFTHVTTFDKIDTCMDEENNNLFNAC